MADQGELFELDVEPTPSSPDRRRTARQRAQVELGIHPLTGGKTRPELGTCGDCVHRSPGSEFRYPKCALGPITKGPGTDVRAHWPACSRFEPREAP